MSLVLSIVEGPVLSPVEGPVLSVVEGLQYWYMLPLAIVIATIATASGVGGATFFAPLFILALGIPPELAVGTALITEVFGLWRNSAALPVASMPMPANASLTIAWARLC